MKRIICCVSVLSLLPLALFCPAGFGEEPSFIWPLKRGSGKIIIPFKDSGTYTSGSHRGIDVEAEIGDEVVSVANGVVHWQGKTPTGDQYVSVQHENGLRTTYMPVETTVQRGQNLKQGDVIGFVLPPAGHATRVPHLHLGVKKPPFGTFDYLDPLALLPVPQLTVDQTEAERNPVLMPQGSGATEAVAESVAPAAYDPSVPEPSHDVATGADPPSLLAPLLNNELGAMSVLEAVEDGNVLGSNKGDVSPEPRATMAPTSALGAFPLGTLPNLEGVAESSALFEPATETAAPAPDLVLAGKTGKNSSESNVSPLLAQVVEAASSFNSSVSDPRHDVATGADPPSLLAPLLNNELGAMTVLEAVEDGGLLGSSQDDVSPELHGAMAPASALGAFPLGTLRNLEGVAESNALFEPATETAAPAPHSAPLAKVAEKSNEDDISRLPVLIKEARTFESTAHVTNRILPQGQLKIVPPTYSSERPFEARFFSKAAGLAAEARRTRRGSARLGEAQRLIDGHESVSVTFGSDGKTVVWSDAADSAVPRASSLSGELVDAQDRRSPDRVGPTQTSRAAAHFKLQGAGGTPKLSATVTDKLFRTGGGIHGAGRSTTQGPRTHVSNPRLGGASSWPPTGWQEEGLSTDKNRAVSGNADLFLRRKAKQLMLALALVLSVYLFGKRLEGVSLRSMKAVTNKRARQLPARPSFTNCQSSC